MKRLLPLLLFVAGCGTSATSKPPHTYQEYTDIMVRLVREKEATVTRLVHAGYVDSATHVASHYNHQIDSVGREQYRWYQRN